MMKLPLRLNHEPHFPHYPHFRHRCGGDRRALWLRQGGFSCSSSWHRSLWRLVPRPPVRAASSTAARPSTLQKLHHSSFLRCSASRSPAEQHELISSFVNNQLRLTGSRMRLSENDTRQALAQLTPMIAAATLCPCRPCGNGGMAAAHESGPHDVQPRQR